MSKKNGHISGILYGLGQLCIFTSYGVLFYAGALFLKNNLDLDVGDVFTAAFATAFGGMACGNNLVFLIDVT